jgi:putative NADPH-quinone reductase
MTKKILIVLAHPQAKSYCGALAQAYADGARTAGAEVRQVNLAEITFNPVGSGSLDKPLELEPALKQAQADIQWAEHLVFTYPILWGTIPALLKGFIERVFAPGFAVNFRKDSPLWDKLLKGRSARLIVTLNTPPLLYRLLFRRAGHITMKRSILEFCGVAPVKITDIGPMKNSSAAKRERWIQQVRALGARLA